MSERPAHPSRQELNAYSLGQLTQDHAEDIDAHISECQPCCETIVDLSSSEDTFVSLLQEARRLSTDHTVDHVDSPRRSSTAPGELPTALANHPRYEVVQLIGKGGMGDVYLAKHRMMDRTVAVKIINRDLVSNVGAVGRFHREVKTAAQLSHPNVVAAFDAEQVDDVHLMVMEHVDGQDLSNRVKDRGPLSIPEACEFTRQAAVGLQHAHDRGMVHRDIKPHNLMVTADGTVKILDFGLAAFAPEVVAEAGAAEGRSDLTQAGAIMGTPDFISPEQADDARQADIRSDIYSLGATFYFLLAGRPPYADGSVLDKLQSLAKDAPLPLESLRDGVPFELDAVISKMMAKDPAERFQAPFEVAEALESLGLEGAGERPATKTMTRHEQKRLPLLLGVATAVLALIAAAVIYYQTDLGVVRIEVLDPSLQVRIDNKAITLETGVEEPVTVRAGEHKLVISQGGVELLTDNFEVRRKGEIAYRVTLSQGSVVVNKQGEEVKSVALAAPPSEKSKDPKEPAATRKAPPAKAAKPITADEIVRRLYKIHGNLVPKLQTMLSEAAGVPNGQWANFRNDPNSANEAIRGEPLSLVMWKLNPLQEAAKNPLVLQDFQYIGVPKPGRLSEAMTPSRVQGYHSMLQPAYISGLGYQLKAGPLNTAKLVGEFRFQAPQLYAGKINFVVRVNADVDLEVTEFTLPNYGIRVVRDANGIWKRAPLPQPPKAKATKPKSVKREASAKPDKAAVARNTLAACEQALKIYKLTTGRYPATEDGLKVLVERPADKRRARSWMGPYLQSLSSDPWGNAYRYRFPGQRGDAGEPDVWSLGPDGEDGTDDDLHARDDVTALQPDRP